MHYPLCCPDTNRTTVSIMANYENISADPQTPESVLSVVDLEHDTSECVLGMTEQKNGPIHCDFQCYSLNPELHQPSEEVETKLTECYETTKTGTLKAPVHMQNNHDIKTSKCKSSPIFKYSPNDKHPPVRRSYKNIKLNDPHAFSLPSVELSYRSSCGDTMGGPLLHSKPKHFIASLAEDGVNLRSEPGNFKIPYGDQEVDGLSQDSDTLSPQYLTTFKESSMVILQDNTTNSKEVSEKGHQKKGCFQKLLEICCITKNKHKTGKSHYTSSEAVGHPVLPPHVITNTQTEDKGSVSRNSEKDAQREGHHSSSLQ